MRLMNPLLRIRKTVLGLTQQELAELTGATQATVSRWERGELEPDRGQLKTILDEARARGVDLDASAFFEQRPAA